MSKIVNLNEKIELKPVKTIKEDAEDNWMYSLEEDTVQLEDLIVLRPSTITIDKPKKT